MIIYVLDDENYFSRLKEEPENYILAKNETTTPLLESFYRARFDFEKDEWFEAGEAPKVQLAEESIPDEEVENALFVVEVSEKLKELEEKLKNLEVVKND